MDSRFSVGTVKWFDKAKGYGFIEGSHDTDVMVYFAQIDMSGYKFLETGETVEYTALFDDIQKRWKAKYVRPIQQAA